MRRVVHNFTSYGLVASLFIIEAPKAGAAEITLTNANNAPINSNINTNAFNSTNGLTNTITWTNTTTAWTNYFASPAGGAPNFNGINWGSSESVNGLVIGGTYAATNVGTLVGVNPFVNVGSATGLIKVNGSFAGTNGLTKKGAGQLNFQSSFNTFTGGLTIEAGRVNFGTSNNIPTSNDLDLKGGSVNFGATNLNLTFANVRWGDGTLTGGAGSSLTAASYTLTNTVDITNSYVLAGAGGLNKSSGAGNFTLNAANTFGGVGVTNIVSAGTLTLGNASALGNTNNSFELRTGGTLNLNNISPTFSTFTFAGGALTTTNTNRSLTANTGFVVTGTNNVDIPYYLQGAGGFTQNGSGTTTLSRTNAYSGATTVSQGTLLVATNGSIASSLLATVNGGLLNVNGAAGDVIVNSGGSLGGSGNVGGVNLKSGSSLRPGNSPGLLTASSATINGGSTYKWETSSVTGTAGTNWDLLSVTGLLDMSGVTSANKWNLVVTGDSGFVGWTGTDSYSYVFAQAASVSGFSSTVGADITNLFNITTSGIATKPNASFNANGDFKVVVGSAGSLTTLNLMAVPEPSAASLMGIGLGSLFILRRFRRRER